MLIYIVTRHWSKGFIDGGWEPLALETIGVGREDKALKNTGTIQINMLDRHIIPIIKPPLRRVALLAHGRNITADQLTFAGFACGIASFLCLVFQRSDLALIFFAVNRLADGIDGELARLSEGTDAGAFLDITLDFVIYALIPVGFALYNPGTNALPAAVLVASFVGTGASFLAFASQADKHAISHPDFSYKGLYYLNGLAEGTETILCFVLMCLFPAWFPVFAYVFAFICVITTVNRIYFGYKTLRTATTKQS